MKNRISIKKATQILLVIFIALVGFKIYSFSVSQISSDELKIEAVDDSILTPKIQIGSKAVFDIIIADDEEEKIRGLSGYTGLEDYQGMAFFFNKLDKHGFWMKDMLFSIDIIYIHNGEVVYLLTNLPYEKATQENVYFPQKPASVVLEVNAGLVEKYGIEVGDKVFYRNIKN